MMAREGSNALNISGELTTLIILLQRVAKITWKIDQCLSEHRIATCGD